MGDFGSSINWINNTSTAQNKLFLNYINKNLLYQHVDKATKGSNILDLIFSTEKDLITKFNIGENFGSSDHQIIRFNINTSYVNEIDKKYVNFPKGDYV